MNILGMDTTGGALGVAVSQGETIISEIFVHNKLTHSATLMPYIEQALFMADMPAEEIEKIAVAVGPGSFTGVRIGVCTAKALAHGWGKPVVCVDALDALAYNAASFPGVISPIMDARRGQVYTAAYRKGEKILPDQALAIQEWLKKLPDEPVLFLGDGVPVLREQILKEKPDAVFAPENALYQHGASVCILASRAEKEESYLTAEPYYLRPSQAERLKG